MNYWNKPQRLAVRKFLAERDGNHCIYCGLKDSYIALTIEHVIPRSRGGSDDEENLRLACKVCNKLKGASTPAEFQTRATIKLRDWSLEWAF